MERAAGPDVVGALVRVQSCVVDRSPLSAQGGVQSDDRPDPGGAAGLLEQPVLG